MAGQATSTPEAYLASLPPDRRHAIATVVDVIRKNLPEGYEERMAYGIVWCVPLSRFPDTYNGEPLGLAGITNQKRYISLYLLTVYGDPATERWFRDRWAASGKRLDMGKSCLRFRTLDDLDLDVIGETIARTSVEAYIERYQAVRGSHRRARATGG